jgi:alpha-mannosidase
MIFPSDIKTDTSHASAQYDVVNHPIRVTPVPDAAWVEDAPTTFPHQGWVDLSGYERGLCVISRGLPEYEVLDSDRREIAVTLLRAVAYLGAGGELQTAAIGAGPNIATPEAQIQRQLNFSLSLLPHKGSWDEAEVWRQALMYNNPPRAYTTAMEKDRSVHDNKTEPPARSFLSVEGSNIILSAVKKAENGEALILRLYNPSERSSATTICLPFIPIKIQSAGLDEHPHTSLQKDIKPVIERGGKVHLSLPPKKIVTLRIEKINGEPVTS